MKIWAPIEPHRTLFETSWVRLAITTPLLFSVGTAIIIFLDPSVDSEVGVSNFEQLKSTYQSMTIPFLVLSLAIPLTALVAGHHRSLQTKHQIEIQDQQNIFSNYVKHRELFIDFFNDSRPMPEGAKEPNEIYEQIFPSSSEGELFPSEEIAPKLQKEIGVIYKKLLDQTKSALEEKRFILDSPEIKNEINDLSEIYKRYSKEPMIPPSMSFENESLPIVHSSITRMDAILSGLYKCANFLRSFYANESVFKVTELSIPILSNLSLLSPRFYTLKQVREALGRHNTKLEQYNMSQLKTALEDIHNNNKLNELDLIELKVFLEEVLMAHLTDDEFRRVTRNLPQAWLDALHVESDDTE